MGPEECVHLCPTWHGGHCLAAPICIAAPQVLGDHPVPAGVVGYVHV